MILQAAIEKQEFGLDLPSAQKHQQNHHIQHDAVLAFQDELSELKKMEVDFLLYQLLVVHWCAVVIKNSPI